MEDQISELLDNFDISIYERNYKECLKFHSIFYEMRSSPNYHRLIQKYETRKFLETNYSLLTNIIVNDLVNNRGELSEKELILLLFQINQSEKAKIANLERNSKKIRAFIRRELGGEGVLISYDLDCFQRVSEKFVEMLLATFQSFSEIYTVDEKKKKLLNDL
jgi:hypothetical protein